MVEQKNPEITVIIPFTEKYGCRIEAFDLASFLHRAIMQVSCCCMS